MFTVLGESLVDIVVTPDGQRAVHPGGSPANVALGLARLGNEVALLTQLGDDPYGRIVRDHLVENKVTLPLPLESGHPTSSALAQIDATGAASYVFDLRWHAPGTGRPLPAHTTHVHTGSIGAVLTPGGKKVPGWLEGARRTSTVSYDPNVRPALMGSPESVRPKIERLVALSDVVKVSDEDLAWLAPGMPALSMAEAWLMSGPAVVVVTRGGQGSFASTRQGSIEIEPVPVEVVDTVGAGDSYMAGLIDGLNGRGMLGPQGRERLHRATLGELDQVLQRAAQIAAITCSRKGADPPTVAELVLGLPAPAAADQESSAT